VTLTELASQMRRDRTGWNYKEWHTHDRAGHCTAVSPRGPAASAACLADYYSYYYYYYYYYTTPILLLVVHLTLA
jgi:hypothetical protein